MSFAMKELRRIFKKEQFKTGGEIVFNNCDISFPRETKLTVNIEIIRTESVTINDYVRIFTNSRRLELLDLFRNM